MKHTMPIMAILANHVKLEKCKCWKHQTQFCTSVISMHAPNELPFTDAMFKYSWVNQDWGIHFPNHVNIWESAHVTWKMNFLISKWWIFFNGLLINNARPTSLSMQAIIKCSSSWTTLQGKHNIWSIFNFGRIKRPRCDPALYLGRATLNFQ